MPVSIHAPVKSATVQWLGYLKINGRFNPRAREERDGDAVAKVVRLKKVSIHAPVKSATVEGRSTRAWQDVSIHAPVKSATISTRYRWDSFVRFNPRAREERDHI